LLVFRIICRDDGSSIFAFLMGEVEMEEAKSQPAMQTFNGIKKGG
jgi:hypothetical protein